MGWPLLLTHRDTLTLWLLHLQNPRGSGAGKIKIFSVQSSLLRRGECRVVSVGVLILNHITAALCRHPPTQFPPVSIDRDCSRCSGVWGIIVSFSIKLTHFPSAVEAGSRPALHSIPTRLSSASRGGTGIWDSAGNSQTLPPPSVFLDNS